MNPLTRKNFLNFVNELLNWKRKTKSKKKIDSEPKISND